MFCQILIIEHYIIHFKIMPFLKIMLGIVLNKENIAGSYFV